MYTHAMVRILVFSVFWGLLIPLFSFGQAPPKREFRAAWVATVSNIDWPSRAGLPTAAQQREIDKLLDYHKQLGMNALILQVRPAGDAFYDSPLEPWSEWLTGLQGNEPQPHYDPLDYFVEGCHQRGMELHAWFNPYRAAVKYDSTKYLAAEHVVHQHPDWFVQYGPHLYFDPGVPDARDYVIDVIADVVKRYDIDGVHFDDYFYPYKIPEQAFPDSASYRTYGGFFNDIEDWRRDNVDELIRLLSRRIKLEKPWVKFGISPFSVWRNKSDDPRGSATRAGTTCYDGLYADVKKWLDRRWIDYVAPQLYFSIGYELVPYEVALAWWRDNANGRHVYAGHGLYKINNNADKRWEDPTQVPRQIRLNREYDGVQGSIFFSARSFNANALGVTDSIQQRLFAHPALLPQMNWLGGRAPESPSLLEASAQRKGVVLTWEVPNEETPAYYAIYRFEGKEPGMTSQATHLMDVIGGERPYYLDATIATKGHYTYVVTALDRLHHESGPDLPYTQVKVKGWHVRETPSFLDRLLGRR